MLESQQIKNSNSSKKLITKLPPVSLTLTK